MNLNKPKADKVLIQLLIGRQEAYDSERIYNAENYVLENPHSLLTEYKYIEEVDPLAWLIDILEESGHHNPYGLATIPFIKINLYTSRCATISQKQTYDETILNLDGHKQETNNKSQTFLRLALTRYFRVYLSSLQEDTSIARFCLDAEMTWPEYYKYFREIVAPILVRNNWDVKAFSKITTFGFEPYAIHPDRETNEYLMAAYIASADMSIVPFEGDTWFEYLSREQIDWLYNKIKTGKLYVHNDKGSDVRMDPTEFINEKTGKVVFEADLPTYRIDLDYLDKINNQKK